jgi:hypothetical protein
MQILAFSTGCGELAAPAALRSADACNVDNRLLPEIDHSDAPSASDEKLQMRLRRRGVGEAPVSEDNDKPPNPVADPDAPDPDPTASGGQ